MVVALGADAETAARRFHDNVRAFFINLNVESIEAVNIDGRKWYRVKPKAGFPALTVGIKDSYLIVAVGEGSLDMILERMQKPAPRWLVRARRIASFERPTGLTYINLARGSARIGLAASQPQRKPWIELLGLTQTSWVVSASGLVGPDVMTRTVVPIDGRATRPAFRRPMVAG